MGEISSKCIKLVDLKYYVDGCGVEHGESLSKGILVDFGNGRYVNPFCIYDSYPIFERSHSSNTTFDGHSFGTRVCHVANKLVTGPCWVLDNKDFSKEIGKDEISLDDLENFILTSNDFYKDRIRIAEKRMYKGKKKHKMMRVIAHDEELLAEMERFFIEREHGIQKVKKTR